MKDLEIRVTAGLVFQNQKTENGKKYSQGRGKNTRSCDFWYNERKRWQDWSEGDGARNSHSTVL